MNKKLLKLIMELIFIFILPLAFMCICIKTDVVNTYDENGNLLTTEKIFDFSENSILRDYNNNITYINKLYLNQYVDCSVIHNFTSGGVTFDSINSYTLSVSGIRTGYISMNLNYVELKYDHKYMFLSNNLNSLYYMNSIGETITYFNNGIPKLFNSNSNGYISIQYSIDIPEGNSYLNLYDLTDMFGAGYEPTTYNQFIQYLTPYYDYNSNEEIIIYSNDIISVNHEYNFTWYSKLFNELYNDLQINNNIILKLITTYIILWVIMFLVWHLLYRFVDFMVHLFDKRE